MKKNLFYMTMLLLLLSLVACNTTEEQPMTEPANDSFTANEGNNTGEITETDEKQNVSSENGDIAAESPTPTTTEVSGELYTMQIEKGFSFTPEEPGKDMILVDENDNVSMRIEVVTKHDTTYEQFVTNTQELMAVINEQYETNDIDALLTDETITNAISYVANVDNEQVITVVFEKGNLLVRLTVFSQNNMDVTDQLIQMGFTIKEK